MNKEMKTYSFNPPKKIKDLSKKLIKSNQRLIKRLEDA